MINFGAIVVYALAKILSAKLSPFNHVVFFLTVNNLLYQWPLKPMIVTNIINVRNIT